MSPRHTCDSGLKAPRGLLDADWAYGVTVCGFVVRAPREPYMRGQSRELQEAMDAHTRDAHPRRWQEVKASRAKSAGA